MRYTFPLEMFVRLSLQLACTRHAFAMHAASFQARLAQHRKGYFFGTCLCSMGRRKTALFKLELGWYKGSNGVGAQGLTLTTPGKQPNKCRLASIQRSPGRCCACSGAHGGDSPP